MNQRIRQLLNEATVGLEPDISPQRTVTLNEMEKFAELIVRECIVDFYRRYLDVTSNEDITVQVDRYVKEHFGVEE